MSKVLIPSPPDLVQPAVVRGLGMAGHDVDVAWSMSPQEQRFKSRFCRSIHQVPSADQDREGYTDGVIELCRSQPYDLIMPTGERTLGCLLNHADKLPNALFPSSENFDMGMDKVRTFEMCAAHGFHHPGTHVIEDPFTLGKRAESLGFPVILKHQRNFGGSYGVRCVTSYKDLEHTTEELRSLSDEWTTILLQEWIPGPLLDVCVVAREGHIGCIATQARRLMYPISGGVAAVVETVEDPKLVHAAEAIIEALNWTGPVQLEFKWDSKAGEYALIEINPRFWGTTGAWLKAGLNFAATAAAFALGDDVRRTGPLPSGLRYIYLLGRYPYAQIQLMRAKGLSAIFDSRRFTRTWYDIDMSDIRPDLLRAYQELRRFYRGERSLKDTSLRPGQISAYVNAS